MSFGAFDGASALLKRAIRDSEKLAGLSDGSTDGECVTDSCAASFDGFSSFDDVLSEAAAGVGKVLTLSNAFQQPWTIPVNDLLTSGEHSAVSAETNGLWKVVIVDTPPQGFNDWPDIPAFCVHCGASSKAALEVSAESGGSIGQFFCAFCGKQHPHEDIVLLDLEVKWFETLRGFAAER